MSIKVTVSERVLHFKQLAGTSRGVYTTRKSWFVHLSDGECEGVGECAPLPDLSCDARPDYGEVLQGFCDEVCRTGQIDYEALRPYPSMLFGLETAMLDLRRQEAGVRSQESGDRRQERGILFDTAFTRGEVGIKINGLVWMGSYEEMLQRMEEKLEKGFDCVKLKIGAIDFERELDLVKRIRQRFSFHDVELRLDANGAFSMESGDRSQETGDRSQESEALYKLELLSQYAIHSIEQPIRQGQWAYMAELCRESPLPIALDEELIGVNDPEMKSHMLSIIKPRYIVLKPSLHGGMQGCREWIAAANELGIGSWITSALESNVGLNAIAQFTSDVYGDDIRMPQGLGTGQLFTDNIEMGLFIQNNMLFRHKNIRT